MKKYLFNFFIIFILLFNIIMLTHCGGGNTQSETNDTTTKIIPRKVLFGNPEKSSPKISPNGEKMAYIAPLNGVLNVWVGDIGQNNYKAITNDTNRGIRGYFWSYDNKHIFYMQDRDGDENWHIYSVNLNTSEVKDLVPEEGVRVLINSYSKEHPDKMLISMNKEDPRINDIYALDLNTGKYEMVEKNPGNIIGYIEDKDYNILGALMYNQKGGSTLLVRDTPQTEWRILVEWSRKEFSNSGPLMFSKDKKHIYCLDSREINGSRLVKINITSGEIDEIIAQDNNYDISGVFVHPDTYEIQAVGYIREKLEWEILDEKIKSDFDAISKLSDGYFVVYNKDIANKTWLVGFVKDNAPIAYFSYNRTTKEGTKLFYNRPELNNYKLSNMKPIKFKSRDGLTIHGYITFPTGQKKQNLPMVLNVHGGPWARDTWGYHPEAQWLANRGYICLQVNFRGSSGYGKEFLNAGKKEWGGKMHDDLIDAVNWAVDKGYADPDRVGIYGGSYGGYAALVGATFTPDVFSCAVDLVGPSNLITFLNTIPPYWEPLKQYFYEQIGNPETEEEFLKSRSPLFHVDNIEIPLLIAQGANDPRVKQAESDQIVQAMKEKGLDVEYLLFEDEGHGFAKPENRLRFYTAVERFLSKHLGGRYQE